MSVHCRQAPIHYVNHCRWNPVTSYGIVETGWAKSGALFLIYLGNSCSSICTDSKIPLRRSDPVFQWYTFVWRNCFCICVDSGSEFPVFLSSLKSFGVSDCAVLAIYNETCFYDKHPFSSDKGTGNGITYRNLRCQYSPSFRFNVSLLIALLRSGWVIKLTKFIGMLNEVNLVRTVPLNDILFINSVFLSIFICSSCYQWHCCSAIFAKATTLMAIQRYEAMWSDDLTVT